MTTDPDSTPNNEDAENVFAADEGLSVFDDNDAPHAGESSFTDTLAEPQSTNESNDVLSLDKADSELADGWGYLGSDPTDDLATGSMPVVQPHTAFYTSGDPTYVPGASAAPPAYVPDAPAYPTQGVAPGAYVAPVNPSVQGIPKVSTSSWDNAKNTLWSLILNGIGILFTLIPGPTMLIATGAAIAALVFGIRGYKRENKRGLAVLGIVLASIGIVISLFMGMLFLLVFAAFTTVPYSG